METNGSDNFPCGERSSLLPRAGSAQMFVWGSMVKFQKTSCNFCAIPRDAAERENFAELGATDPKRAFGSGHAWDSKIIYC